jgi:hypothetical protein
MMRYGVFNLGQLWCVVAAEGAQLGFPKRQAALDAAGLIASAHRACGEKVEVLVQDGVGRLSLLNEAALAQPIEDAPDAEPVLRMRPNKVHLRTVD